MSGFISIDRGDSPTSSSHSWRGGRYYEDDRSCSPTPSGSGCLSGVKSPSPEPGSPSGSRSTGDQNSGGFVWYKPKNEEKPERLPEVFAKNIRSNFLCDNSTMGKSIEKDFPIPANGFLKPPRYDQYTELLVDAVCKTKKLPKSAGSEFSRSDARLSKLQASVARVSGPLTDSLRFCEVAENQMVSHATWSAL